MLEVEEEIRANMQLWYLYRLYGLFSNLFDLLKTELKVLLLEFLSFKQIEHFGIDVTNESVL